MSEANELIPTRHSLLDRLKDWSDHESWKVFFDTYWRLIYRTAIKAGLTDAEAQDVVQETVISVLKSMPEFETRSRKGSFKSWLLRLTGWRITDQLRKRQRHINRTQPEPLTSTKTAVIERVPDPAGQELEALWDKEWEMNILEAAVDGLKKKVEARQFQIFDLHVLQEWPVSRVAQALKINRAAIYLTKHRLNKLLKKEIARLRTKPI